MADPDERPGYEWNIHIVQQYDPNMRICFMSNIAGNGDLSEANAALIVRAVNGLPEAIAALEDTIAMLQGSKLTPAYKRRLDAASAALTKLKG